MPADDQPGRRNKPVPLLVVEGNKDHQLLIGYCIRTKLPQVQPVFANTPQEALTHLELTDGKPNVFPRLVQLDPCLPDPNQGWPLLTELRSRFPCLLILILSSQPEASVISKAYELGAHSFLAKPLDLPNWEACFDILNQYWFRTITLPPATS